MDDLRASAGARSKPVPLLRTWKGSSAAGAIEFHARGCFRRGWSPRTTRCCFASRRQSRSRPSEVPLARAAVAVGRRAQRRGAASVISHVRGGVMSELLLDAAGRRRSPATLPEFHAGRSPRNKGMRYPADPPTIEEIVTVMRRAGDRVHGRRLRGLIVVLWRAGLRIHEALALAEADLDPRRGSLLVRRGKGGRRREVGMDDWAWEQLQPWL